MKLDENTIANIMELHGKYADWDTPYEFEDFLKKLDLVIKPGDSSQGTLVENK